MRTETVIDTSEVEIGAKLILKNGKEAIIKGFWDSVSPLISKVYSFETDMGIVLPNEVERIVNETKI